MAYQMEDGGWVKTWVDRGPFGFNIGNPEGAQAAGAGIAGAMGALGKFADAYGNIYGNAMQGISTGLSGIGKSHADTYGAYAGGLGNVAQAMANERSNYYTSNAMAEAARQQSLGNMGVAALSNYGGAANSALAAWAQNQMAYNKAASDLGVANQNALSQYGSSRNSALGNLGGAYATLGGKGAAAGVLSGLNLNMSGGFNGLGGGLGNGNAFNAYGPNGPIASGSYGAYGGGGNGMSGGYSGSLSMTPTDVTPYLTPAYQGLGGLQGNLMAGDITGSLNNNYASGMQSLNDQHATSRAMPSQMLDQTLGGLMTLGNQGYGQIANGMNQFYSNQSDPRNRADFGGVLDRLAGGYETANTSIGTLPSQLKDMYATTLGDAAGGLGSLYDKSLGRIDFFKSPMQIASEKRAVDLYGRRNAAVDKVYAAMNDLNSIYFPPEQTRRRLEIAQRNLNNIPVA